MCCVSVLLCIVAWAGASCEGGAACASEGAALEKAAEAKLSAWDCAVVSALFGRSIHPQTPSPHTKTSPRNMRMCLQYSDKFPRYNCAMRREGGFVGFLVVIVVGIAALYFYVHGLPGKGPEEKSPLEIQMNALQQAKGVQDLNEKHNKEIDAAMRENSN